MSNVNSTSSSSSTGGTYSTRLRLTGMASGLDVDATVKKLMEAETLKLTKLDQTRQYTQWRQDALRDIIKDIRTFRQSYLLYESPDDTNMIKSKAYSGALVTASDPNNLTSTTTGVTATALPGAAIGVSNIKVDQMAKSAKYVGANLNNNSVAISNRSDYRNKTINFTINGTQYAAKLADTDFSTASDSDILSAVNTAIDTAINSTTGVAGELNGKVTASIQSGKITFNSLNDNNVRVSSDISDLSNLKVINPNTSTLLSDLGITDGKLRINVGNQTANVTVNSGQTVQDLINNINNASIGSNQSLYSKLKVNFNELTGNLTIETRDTGSNNTLKLTGLNNDNTDNNAILKGLGMYSTIEGTNLADGTTASTTLSALGMSGSQDLKLTVNGIDKTINLDSTKTIQQVVDAIKAQGIDAEFDAASKKFRIFTKDGSNLNITSDFSPLNIKYNGGVSGQDSVVEITPPGSAIATKVVKSNNDFTIDNMTYSILKDPNGTAYNTTLTTKADASDSIKKIKSFIETYNGIVKKINDKIGEKKGYNYKPLTDDQKNSMTENQIKAWEDKSKQGIIRNDGQLQSMLSSMRSAFMDTVKSAGISLKELGIDTYSGLESISKPGQFKLDEAKLKTALETRGDQVMKIFTTKPDSSITNAAEKYNNTGIFQRVEDIIDNAAVKIDADLLQTAGFEGTYSETTNTITKDLKKQDDAIYEMKRKLADKEDAYYKKFSALETAMTKLNAQQASLSQQLGS